MADISKNIESIKNSIIEAAKRSNFNEEVKLVAVTKYQTDEAANEAIRCGITDIGENHVQSLLRKENILLPCKKHFIGHLQTNKVKQLLTINDLVLIHSVDSLHLAKEIDRCAGRLNKNVDILLQINVSGEETKFGVPEAEAIQLLTEVSKLPNICVKGFMSIMPVITKSDYYKRMRYIYDNAAQIDKNITILSMGMSGDYELAVENGSNLVRVGSLMFS